MTILSLIICQWAIRYLYFYCIENINVFYFYDQTINKVIDYLAPKYLVLLDDFD